MKKHTSVQFFTLLLAAFILLSSCQNKSAAPSPPTEKIGLETAVWQLTDILTDSVPMPVPDTLPVPITVKFSGGNIEGFGGCNSFGSTFTVDGDRLAVGGIRITRMFCGGVSEWENYFVQRLEKSQTFRIDGERLEIQSGDMGGLVFRLNWKKRPG